MITAPVAEWPSLEHLIALSDDVGIIQHAIYDVPNRSTGYCTDDVARAFMVAVTAAERPWEGEKALPLTRRFLAFLLDAQLPDGRFHNFMSYERTWLDDVGTQDANGRALWALGFGARFAPLESWREVCTRALARALPFVSTLGHIRSQAYCGLGLAHALEASACRVDGLQSVLRSIGVELRDRYAASAGPRWDWFENAMTYDNARLSEAALRIGTVLDDPALVGIGLRTLDFYESVTVEGGVFVPIGNEGWYVRGGRRARYAQQPLEAAALVDAGLAAHAVTGHAEYRELASLGLGWYAGRNSLGALMTAGGGCFDGLEAHGPNRNMGAESTLAYLASAQALANAATNVVRLERAEVCNTL